MDEVEKYICVYLNKNATRNCDTCTGITNLCGLYENRDKIGLDEVIDRLTGQAYDEGYSKGYTRALDYIQADNR